VTRPFSALPLTDEQLAEVLRVMSESFKAERHIYRLNLLAERGAARGRAISDPERKAEHRAAVEAYERALALLETCWPTWPH
jgi:hypothetical protein